MTDFLVNDDDSALLWPKPTDTPPAPALGALLARHTPGPAYPSGIDCGQCGQGWPCDAHLAAEAIDAQAARLAAILPAAERMARARQTWLRLMASPVFLDDQFNTDLEAYNAEVEAAWEALEEAVAGAVGAGDDRDDR